MDLRCAQGYHWVAWIIARIGWYQCWLGQTFSASPPFKQSRLANILVASDASRSRIIIKPRLKEYVKKQREARRTLACFTSLDDPTPEDSESPTSSSSPTTPLTTYKPSTVKALDAPKFLRSSQPEGSKQSIKVHSGRIKKSPKAASKVLADIAKPSRPTSIPTAPRALRFHPAPAAGPTPVALAAVPSAAPTPVAPIPAPAPPLKQRQPCTCHDPEACPYCRFLALADMQVPKADSSLQWLTISCLLQVLCYCHRTRAETADGEVDTAWTLEEGTPHLYNISYSISIYHTYLGFTSASPTMFKGQDSFTA